MASKGSRAALEEIAVLRAELLAHRRPVTVIVEAIVERFGVSRLKAQRLARGWTRRQAVERILATYDADGLARPSLTPRRLCAWEHDRRMRPGEDYLDRLCRVYQTRADRLGYGHDHTPPEQPPGAEGDRHAAMPAAVCDTDGGPYSGVSAALAFPLVSASVEHGVAGGSADSQGEEVAVNRDEFLRAMGATGVAALLGGAAEASMRLSAKLGSSNLGPVTLDQLRLRAAGFIRDYDHTPSERLLAQVLAQHRQVEALLDGGQPLGQRRELHRVAGQLSFLLGSLSFELGAHDAAAAHLLTAGQLAEEAGDDRLLGWVRMAQSTSAFWAGDFGTALRYAQDGQRYTGGDGDMSARLAARGEARAYARIGDHQGVIDALGRAGRAMPSQPAGEDPDGWWAWSPADLERNTALSLLWLGQPEDAEPHARQAIKGFASAPAGQQCPPDLALASITLATCMVRQGSPEEGIALATEALEATGEGREAKARHARELLGALSPQQRGLPAACEFADRLRTACAPRPALTPG